MPAKCRASTTWAQRLKRVFTMDNETYRASGGAVRIIAWIEDPVAIEKILTHLKETTLSVEPVRLSESRAPPVSLFD